MLFTRVHGQGRPLVILHGATLDHRHMQAALEPAFAGRDGWQRIYVDLPGHGQSPADDAISCQDDMLDAVARHVATHLGDAPYGVIGLSRGSYLAQGLIFRAPEQIRGAVLIVPGGAPTSPHPLPGHVVLQPDPALRETLSEEELWGFDNMLVAQSRHAVARRREVILPAKALHDADQAARVNARFTFGFAEAEARHIYDGPSLVLAGRQDSMCGYRDALDLAERYSRSTFAVLDATGHALEQERPDVLTALLHDWLDRLSVSWPA